jgi:amino acid transporter
MNEKSKPAGNQLAFLIGNSNKMFKSGLHLEKTGKFTYKCKLIRGDTLEALMYLFNIIIAVYLFMDAKKHDKNPWLWGILGLLFSFITLGSYWIKTGKKVLGWVILIACIIWVILGIIGVVAFGLFNALN